MAHEFESGLTVGEKSWHGLEHNQQEEVKTVREALLLAELDWLVRTDPLYRILSDGTPLEAETRAVVRLTDNKTLGEVGTGFVPVQNTDAFEPCQPLVDAGYMKIATAGSLKGGSKVYMSFKIGGEAAEVVPGDVVEGYFLAYQGFDGKLRLAYKHTPTRVVCANTLGIAIVGDDKRPEGYTAEGIFFSHRSGIDKRVEELKGNMGRMADDFTKSIEAYRHIAGRQVNPQKFFERLLGIEERRLAAELAGEEASGEGRITFARLMEAYETQPGANFAAGSGWQAYNAVTYHVDHKRGKDENRADNAWFGIGATIKREALKMALAA